MPNSKNYQQSTKKKASLLPHGFKAKAERISAEYRNYLNLKDYDPCPALLLTSYLNIHVKEVPHINGITTVQIDGLLDEFSGAFSAVTIYCPDNNRHMIVHNHAHSPSRKESNLMHECAHIILDHKMEEFDKSNGFMLRNYNEVQEEEAKFLGHCLQLPKAALTTYYVYADKSKEDIAELFNVSAEVIRFRIGICGIEGFKKNAAKYR